MRSPAPRFPRLRSWWARLGRVGRRIVDLFPFTPLGLVTGGASALALWRYGVARVALLYLVIGAVGLGVAAVSLLSSVLAAVRVRISLRAASRGGGAMLRLESGVRSATGFSLPSPWYLPLCRVRW